MQPVRRHGVDAAVLFSDIVVPAHAVGFGIDVAPGTGPVAGAPLARGRRPRPAAAARRRRPTSPTWSRRCGCWSTSCRPDVPLLAFAGAPFTVASYLIEGRPSRTYQHTKQMIHTEPRLWHTVMERLVQHSVAFIDAQLQAGARAFQLFDSWAGSLSARRLPHVRAAALDRGVHRSSPSATRACRASTSASAATTCSSRCCRPPGEGRATPVLGLDWRTRSPMHGSAWAPIWSCRATSTRRWCWPARRRRWPATEAVLADNAGHPGHVFNLGHGVQPDTDPDVLTAIVHHVHTATARSASASPAAPRTGR